MAIVLDRFNILSEAIQNLADRQIVREQLRSEGFKFGTRVVNSLRKAAPSGEKWEDPPEVFRFRKTFYARKSPRPSLRQHGLTLSQGWQRPVVDFLGSTGTTIRASITADNIAPQINFILDGTKSHYVTKFDGPLYFYDFKRRLAVFHNVTSMGSVAQTDWLDHTMNTEITKAQVGFDRIVNRLLTPLRNL